MTLFATASWVVPAITAATGLLGVLVGGAINWLVERKNLADRNSRALCVAARLVYDELTTIRADALAMREVEMLDGLPFTTAVWEERRADLASPELDIEHFKALTVIYAVVDAINQLAPMASKWTKEEMAGEVAEHLDDRFMAKIKEVILVISVYAGDHGQR
jgi:xanthosine utilization system XapX-like protein